MHDEGDEVKIAVCRLTTPQIMRIGLHHGKGVSAGTVGIAGTANTAGDGLRITGVQLNPVQCQNLALALYQASQAMGKVNAALGLN